MNIKVSLMLVNVLVFIVLSLSGCTYIKEKISDAKLPRGADLAFENIYDYKPVNHPDYFYPQLFVLSSEQSAAPEYMNWLSPESQSRFLSTDFSN